MSLLSPWALWFLFIPAGIVALYLLKIRRVRQTVPALDFWRQLASQTQVRSLFQRLKRWLSLALWLLIAFTLILALGNPIFSLGRIKPQSIVVIMDNSASMQSLEKDKHGAPQSRWSMALAAIDDITSRRPVMDEWLLINAALRPEVTQPWTTQRRDIIDVAKNTNVHLGVTDLDAAVTLGRHLLAGKSNPCILIVSDGANGQVQKFAAGDPNVVQWQIGETSDNLGIARLSVRRSDDQSTCQVFIRVVNASHEQVKSQLLCELDNSITAVEPITLDPLGDCERTIELDAPQGGVLKVAIDRPDALNIDNEAFAVVPPVRKASIHLVTPPDQSFFFEQALAAMESFIDGDSTRLMQPEEFDAAQDKALADITIFNNCKPSKLPPRGNFIFINRFPAELRARSVGPLNVPTLSITDRNHPLTRYLALNAVALAHAMQVDLLAPARILAASSSGIPLIFLIEEPDRSALCLAFDVLESDMPFRVAFPILLRNAVAYFSAHSTTIIKDQYQIGERIEPLRLLPDNLKELTVGRLTQRGIDETPLQVSSGSFSFEHTEHPGALRFRTGDVNLLTAINLSDESESRIAPDHAQDLSRGRLELSSHLGGAVPWLALSMAALGLICVEWLTYHFRWTE